MNDQISRQLREAAQAHQPDRARMLARVNRGIAATSTVRPASGISRPWARVALAGVAAAGVLVVAGIAFDGIVRTGPATETTMPVAPNSATSPSPAPSSATPPDHTGEAAPPVITRQDPPGNSNSPATTQNRLADGPLSSKGSVDPGSHTFWTQDKLVLDVSRPLSKLTVQVHIAQTGGVQSSGQWQTGPGDDFSFTVQEIDGEVVYRWDLKPGHTIPAAQQIFAVQFNHTRGARDGKADKYGVMATAAGHDHAVWGDFKP